MQVIANVTGIRKLVADGYSAAKHAQLVEFYADVREPWFELLQRTRTAKRQRETKKDGGKLRVPVGRPLSSELIGRFDLITRKYKLPGIIDGRQLVDFLKRYPPSRNSSREDTGASKQIERRDLGFAFEGQLMKRLRASGTYLWVGRSAGSYGAIDIIAISRKGVMLAQCKATEAERTMKSEYVKLAKTYRQLGHLAEMRMYFKRDGQTVYVKLDESSMSRLAGVNTRWSVVSAAISLVKRSPTEFKQMIAALKTRLHWNGSETKLATMYENLVPFWRKLAAANFQWSAELRIEYRKLLDPYRGYLVSQDAHVTKALLLPRFAPLAIVQTRIDEKRDPILEQRIFKQAGFAMRVEHESGYETPIHVVRATSNGSKLIVYHCVRSGQLDETKQQELGELASKLPKCVEFRVAWYENRKMIRTRRCQSITDFSYFSKARGVQ
jgi:hypothetical protein